MPQQSVASGVECRAASALPDRGISGRVAYGATSVGVNATLSWVTFRFENCLNLRQFSKRNVTQLKVALTPTDVAPYATRPEMPRSGRADAARHSTPDATDCCGMSYDLIQTVQNLGQPRLLVLGDLILDRYTWGDAERVSQEAPVILLRADRREVRLGGAGNVGNMLRALGARPLLAGV